MGKHLTSPLPSKKMPGGIPYIIGNEAAERFSFYGMKAILTIFMTRYLLDASGDLDVMSEGEAKSWYHLFASAAYFTPILGALLSDIFLGKYRTIIVLSIVYCLGHLALALDETRLGLTIGLTLIAIGAGGIKPCVSAHVGDQFGKSNQHLIEKVFGWFYFSINVGSVLSTLLIPILLDKYGPHIAFGLPGLLMLLATIVFWMGRHKFVHIPAGGMGFVKEAFSGEGWRAMVKLFALFAFVPMFWALFDQTGSAWVLQSQKMDRDWLNHEWLPSQIQAANPFFVLLLIPLFTLVVYPAVNRIFRLTALRKIAIGFFIAAAAFAVCAMIETDINGGDIAKVSSTAAVKDMNAINLLDGDPLTSWSSGRAGAAGHEIVVRLRERRSWNIESVVLTPSLEMTQEEVVSDLDAIVLESKKAIAAVKEAGGDEAAVAAARQRAEELGVAFRAVTNAPDVGRAIAEARKVTDAGFADIDDYQPADISIWTGNFIGDDVLVPVIASELKGDEAEGYDPAARGWTQVATMATAGAAVFDPVAATHVLIRIAASGPGPRVKLAEVAINTADGMPPESNKTGGGVWPNVAAIGFRPSISWQLLAYLLITIAEVLVSITCLEFAYTQAPRKMKSFIMSFYLLAVSMGNLFVSLVNRFILREDGSSKLEGASYYWFFTLLMLVMALLFLIVVKFYKEKTYVQEEADEVEAEAEMR